MKLYHKRLILSLLIVVLCPFKIQSAFFLFNSQHLVELKNHIAIGNEAFQLCYLDLIKEAEGELASGPYSVIDKKLMPRTGDKHDYISLARYYWPDPIRENGLPYIHRDCEVNPDIFKDDYDNARKCKMIRACIRLCLAYYLSKDEKFAFHASFLVKTWFLDPNSYMHPHLNFSQIQPGITDTNHFGIIEGHTFPYLFDALNFLEGSPFWTVADMQGMEEWATDYLEWLLYSPSGIRARDTFNNHSTWYDMQVIYFSLYTHQEHFAKEYIEEYTFNRLQTHFAKDYSQPHEMRRKKNFYYSIFNLKAFFNCALLGMHIHQNLWETDKEEKGTLRQSLDFLIPYIENEKEWKNGKIESVDFVEIAPLLLIASTIYKDSKYLKLYEKVEFLIPELSDSNNQVPHKLLKLLYPESFFWNKD